MAGDGQGLDITTRRAVLALHAALTANPGRFAGACRELSGALDAPPALNQVARILARHAGEGGLRADFSRADAALAWQDLPDNHLIFISEPDYPDDLRTIPAPPPLLFVQGETGFLQRHGVAIVGSRKAGHGACAVATGIAGDLVDHGLVITSGLALGIDAAAHRAALSRGGGTIAVFGCGLDNVYPRRHRALAGEIAARGALVSEFPLGSKPLKHHFPQRNRLIAGLCAATVVVAAARRSGSISTAMHALEQGRGVFAVPGHVRDPLAHGCHALIRQGAVLTESAADILGELSMAAPIAAPTGPATARSADSGPRPDPEQARFLEYCGWAEFTIDSMVAVSGLTVQKVSSMLIALELLGLVESKTNGTYVRIR